MKWSLPPFSAWMSLTWMPSWYVDSSKKGTGDWGCGLGNYADDRVKYPLGLASISHRVHEAGMKFGLWVGPNVVDSRIVGNAIPKLWIAQVDGKDQTLQPSGWESPVSQVCLGCREYLDYLKKELIRIVRGASARLAQMG